MNRLLRRLLRDRRGNVLIEVAIALPILVMLLLTGVEFTRYVLIHQKVERTSATVADLVAQLDKATNKGVNGIFEATEYVMDPFDLAADGSIVVSSIAASDTGAPRIAWQRAYGNGKNASAFGKEGGPAKLPSGLVLRPGDNLIACEAFYAYTPILPTDILEQRPGVSLRLFHAALHVPRRDFRRLNAFPGPTLFRAPKVQTSAVPLAIRPAGGQYPPRTFRNFGNLSGGGRAMPKADLGWDAADG